MGVYRVLVRIDRSRLRVGGEGAADRGQGVGGQEVVMVEEYGRLAVRQRQGGVGGPGHALGLGVDSHPDTRVGGLGPAKDFAHHFRA